MNYQNESPLLSRSGAYSNQFDAIRLFAAFLVLIGHCFELHSPITKGGIGDPMLYLTGLESLGGVGVIIFFSVSGYLVADSMLRTKHGFEFLWKRVLRIYPALTVLVVISIFLVGPLLSRLSLYEYFSNELTWHYAKNLIFVFQPYLPLMLEGNPLPKGINGSLWTLAIEVKLYFILAVLCFLGNSVWRQIAIGIYVLLFLVLFYWHFFIQPLANVLYFETSGYAALKLWSAFLIGNCIRIYALEGQLLKLVLINFAVFVICVFFKKAYSWFAFTSLLSFCVIYVGIIKSKRNYSWKKLDISYGVYLWAFPVQQCLLNYFPEINFYLFVICTIMATVTLAYCNWIFIEYPALRFKAPKKSSVWTAKKIDGAGVTGSSLAS